MVPQNRSDWIRFERRVSASLKIITSSNNTQHGFEIHFLNRILLGQIFQDFLLVLFFTKMKKKLEKRYIMRVKLFQKNGTNTISKLHLLRMRRPQIGIFQYWSWPYTRPWCKMISSRMVSMCFKAFNREIRSSWAENWGQQMRNVMKITSLTDMVTVNANFGVVSQKCSKSNANPVEIRRPKIE